MNTDRFKFRAWNKKRKKYISENRVCICNGNAYYLDPYGEEFFLDENSFVIEQCTGQKDENGKLIYENDVVSVYNPLTDAYNKCVVKWLDDASGYICIYLEPKKVIRGCAFASTSGTYLDGLDCEIIGNIHDQEGAEK